MNLTKMREFKWVDYMNPLLTKFKFNITYGDQDIINIIFHYHPGKFSFGIIVILLFNSARSSFLSCNSFIKTNAYFRIGS